ncbi:MAG: helix-turn-helix transcriptional regulator [Lachnospiraceae bacterium]|nr:helix-turn-helix transcriptional regulator [Lachnospiraceae bacterium]
MNFAERLTMLRKARKIPLKEVAGYLRVSVSTMSNYESGLHQPDFGILCRLADYYGVSTDYLLGRTSCVGSDRDMVRQHPLLKRREKLFFETENLTENNLHTVEKLVQVMKKYEIFMEKNTDLH